MKRTGASRTSSYIVRVSELGRDRVIRVQDVSTGETVEFRNWQEFLRFAQSRRGRDRLH